MLAGEGSKDLTKNFTPSSRTCLPMASRSWQVFSRSMDDFLTGDQIEGRRFPDRYYFCTAFQSSEPKTT